jgi:hypothetical protein
MLSSPVNPRAPVADEADPNSTDNGRLSGFGGQVWCSSLADLVQLECLSGTRTAVRVASRGNEGYLFFDRGRICHAVCGDLSQEDAALEMLAWDTGNFEQANLDWPNRSPMTANWQELLMNSAQRRDEAARPPSKASDATPPESLKRVVNLKNSSAPPKPMRPTRTRSDAPAAGPSARPVVPVFPVVPVLASPTARQAPKASVLLGPNGEVLGAKGEGERLVALGAYVRRLCDLLARELGGEAASGFECLLGDRRLLLEIDDQGRCLAIETQRDVEIEVARRWLSESPLLSKPQSEAPVDRTSDNTLRGRGLGRG